MFSITAFAAALLPQVHFDVLLNHLQVLLLLLLRNAPLPSEVMSCLFDSLALHCSHCCSVLYSGCNNS